MRNKSLFHNKHNAPHNNPMTTDETLYKRLLESNGTQGRTVYLDLHDPGGLFILIAC